MPDYALLACPYHSLEIEKNIVPDVTKEILI